MTEWLDFWNTHLWWLAIVSAVSFVASLMAVPLIAVRIPRDYFASSSRRLSVWEGRHFVVRTALGLFKNLLGIILILAGILMLVLPGQGLLTILIGLLLVNFPGKYRLERYLITRGPVLRGINWIRQRWGVPPLAVSAFGRDAHSASGDNPE